MMEYKNGQLVTLQEGGSVWRIFNICEDGTVEIETTGKDIYDTLFVDEIEIAEIVKESEEG